ncbi:hypothetical protein ALC56_02319 [Trachymyrmex septentrionalis]|uniref:Uncharacterized protein n=1 Tax=Trachymyrmex septentrionalis TaxID=34720 RepID=A0A151K0R9_9HYME|nr:hypothetical protein ALC56_02319 [Trachymyrmex septentrionalis]
MACGTVLLKPHIGHINIIQFRQKELCYHVAISSTSNSHCLTSLIFKKVWSNDASSPKSTPNSDTLWMHLFFDNHMWVLRTPKAAILVINKAIKVKMCFIALPPNFHYF